MGGEQSVPYRGAKRARDDEAMEEALELLRIQSHDELSRVHVRHLSFKPTWTKLAEYCVTELSSAILTLTSDSELHDVIHISKELQARLQERDASDKSRRVTKETREGIHLTCGVANVLHLLQRIRDGSATPSFENAGLASTLRARWRRLGRVPEYAERLVRDAVGRVLTSDATDGVKNFYSRVLLHWVPDESPREPRGERLTFDSDDDL